MSLFHLLALLPAVAQGFLQPASLSGPPSVLTSSTSAHRRITKCSMSADDDNGDDDSIDPNSLGDWRTFRMNLANSGLSSTSTSSVDGIDLEESEESSAVVSTAAEAKPSSTRPKSVSKKNEQLLSTQNSALAEEYRNGVWAHESAIPEVGGLVCRLPLEAEIYRGDPNSDMHKKLHDYLNSEEYGGQGTDFSIPDTLASAASTGGAASASAPASSSAGIIERSEEDSPISEDDDDATFSALAANTVYWYRGAEKLLKNELLKITSSANSNGRIDADNLDSGSLELLQLYMDHQQSWQEVCLVVDKDERTGRASTLTINRPMAFKLSESLGRLVLFGALAADGKGSVNYREKDGMDTQNVVKFLGAFENECGVYVGGPDDMDKPAVMVHGIDDLPGAVEISPGTGIYKGGLEAACDGVLSGKYKPLDFRFFIGHTKYEGGELDEAVSLGKYQPVACSRPLVLKQCIQLPKPLWHEVLEFCGGELKEISKLELAKRDDLQ